MTIGGKRLLDLDPYYYSRLVNLTIRNQPNSKGKAHNDQDVSNIAHSSLWRCGDNGWIVFETYCTGGVTLSGDGKTSDSCVGPVGYVPQSKLSHAWAQAVMANCLLMEVEIEVEIE